MKISMSEEARQAKREYEREWARKNPDKVRVKNARYWEKRAKRLKEERESNCNG